MGTDPKPIPSAPPVRFDLFELDSKNAQLRRAGLPVDVSPQALKILALLTEHPNELVSRDDIKGALWPAESHGDFDSRLNFAVKRLREALGDDAEQPRYIQTIRNAGYRFIAPVRPASTAEMPTPLVQAEVSRVPLTISADRPVGIVSHPLISPALRFLLMGFALGFATFGLAQKVLNVHLKPVIESVSAVEAEQVQQIRIVGHGLGRHAPFFRVGLDTPYLMIGDDTEHWMAGQMNADSISDVTVLVQDWSDTLITIKGFSGMYGQGDPREGNWRLHLGDKVRIRVWDPQHQSAGFAECTITVGSGDTVCSK